MHRVYLKGKGAGTWSVRVVVDIAAPRGRWWLGAQRWEWTCGFGTLWDL